MLATTARSLGQVFDPYFNRSAEHFCNHLHTPAKPVASGFDCAVAQDDAICLAHPVFSIYGDKGAVAVKQYVARAIDKLLGNGRSIECSLPSFARVTLRHQPQHRRHVAHLLCAVAVSRGTFRDKPIGVIEDAITLHEVQVTVRTGQPIASATLEPQGVQIPVVCQGDAVSFTVPRLDVHQMVVLHHAP